MQSYFVHQSAIYMTEMKFLFRLVLIFVVSFKIHINSPSPHKHITAKMTSVLFEVKFVLVGFRISLVLCFNIIDKLQTILV